MLERRRQDLEHKCPGAVAATSPPQITWIRMLKRPTALSQREVFSLRGKFNAILEERLLDGDEEQHHIMSIDVPSQHFDSAGDLTTTGLTLFWKEVIQAITKYDDGKIKLKPRKNTVPDKKMDKHERAGEPVLKHKLSNTTAQDKSVHRQSLPQGM